MTTALLASLLLASTPARYLSAEGDDAADGCSPETAWRTVGRLNEGLPAGGRACLRAGDVFYGTVEVKGGPDPDHPTVVTSYGEGAKPVVSNTKNLKRDPKLWTLFGTGTNGDWRFDLRNDANYDSNVVRSCSQAFEIWVMKAAGGIGFRRCSFTHNTVSDTGGGWGELTRPNRRCATPLLIYNTESDTFDIEVRDNDFGTPKHGLIHTIDGTVPEGYRIK